MTSYTPPILTVAVLSFNKERETRLCLESLRAHLKVPDSQVVLLENGSEAEYPWTFYREGLCDAVIVKRRGNGGGVGQTDLFRFSPSRYTLFVQCDQTLRADMTQQLFEALAWRLEMSEQYDVIDLNGDQSGRGVWTDRAHLVKTAWFNGLGPFPNGGPGEFHHVRWNENYLQEKVKPERICHVKPALFADIGSESIRTNPDGSLWKHYTDTKQLWLLKGPVKERYVYPQLSEAEWVTVLTEQRWPDGQIPEQEKANSFHVWH